MSTESFYQFIGPSTTSLGCKGCTSFEGRQYTSDDDALCPPLVDIRVTKVAQFRFGVPLKFTRRVAAPKSNEVGLVAVYTIQLGAPKQHAEIHRCHDVERHAARPPMAYLTVPPEARCHSPLGR